jgi:cell division protein FtsN
VSSPRQRISARDYKNGGKPGSFDIGKYQQFGSGLAVGLLVALGVFVFENREKAPDEETPQSVAAEPESTAAAAEEDPAEQYDFYDMLPKFEVVVPEVERDVKRDLPAVPVKQAGAYVLQVGSFANQADAERLRLKLDKLGIDANLQRIQIDEDVRHRVRIGPLRDLDNLNNTRRQLRAADMDALLIRIGD